MITQAISSAMNTITANLAEISVPATILKNAEVYDLAIGQNVLTQTTQEISGIVDIFEFKEIDNTKVFQDDVKFLVLSTSEIVFKSLVDQIKIDGVVYNILGFHKESVGSLNVLYTLHLRV